MVDAIRFYLCLCLLWGLPLAESSEDPKWWSGLRATEQKRRLQRITYKRRRPSTLVTLTYYDPIDNEEESWRRKNLVFFFKKAILPHPEYHYVIVFQGCHQIEVPDLPNVEVLEHNNTCFDAGGWLDVLTLMRKRNRRFKHYIFLNGSVRGPFMPMWAQTTDWVTAFTWPLVDERYAKLVGTSLNCRLGPEAIDKKQPLSAYVHLQSMILATDYEGVKMCLRPAMEEPPCLPTWTRDDVIAYRELYFTRCFLDKGYSVRSLSVGWQGVNISESNREAVLERCLLLAPRPEEKLRDLDIVDQGQYGRHNISYTPLELIFFETNRDIVKNYVEQYTIWAAPELNNLTEALGPYLRAEPRGVGCPLERA